MSRHRNVRSMNIDEEYDGYDDVYGHSVEDDHCVSPATAAQFMYNREGHDLSSYIHDEVHEPEIPEEDEGSGSDHEPMNDSGKFQRPKLSDIEQARLNSCLEQLQNVVGEAHPEHVMVSAIMANDYDPEKAINSLLEGITGAPKPQRAPRASRRSKNTATNATAVPHLEPVPVTALKNGQKTSVITSPTSDRVADVTTGVARMTFTAETVKMKGFHLKTGENMTGNKSDGNILDTLQVQDSKRTASPRSGSPAKVDDFKRASSPAKSDDTGDNGASVSSSRKSKQVERVDVGKEIEKRKDGKDLINLVVIGHVDAGKSTLMGHLLFQLGMVSKRNMHKYEQESKKVGKASFAYAWVLDETEEERSRGVTMDIAKSSFSTNSKNIILLDAPGHKDFIPNMITGAAQADVAVLVVNATKGEFETGFEAGGQTREHALLVRSLGVSQLVVAVNKMDTVDWSETRYQEIVKKLGAFLKQAGFKEQDLNYVPCSGFTGENLTSRSIPELSWYAGHSLVERIDRFRPPDRLVDKAFRMCVGDVFKGMGSGFCVSGRLEAGSVQTTDRLLVMPISQIANVKSIQDNEELLQCAIAGDYVTLTLTGIDMDRVTLGSILCDPTQPIYSSTRIIARVVTFNIDIPLTKGFPVVFHYQTMSEPAVIHKLVSLLNKSTGEVLKNKPRCLTKNSNAVIELALSRPVCVELYKDYKNLGRFMIRYGGATIGAGLVTKLKDVKS